MLDVRGSIALGMILVACCPPGNVSNILTHRAGGDVALSVSMTAISNLLTIFMLPINLAFWGGSPPPAATLLQDVDLDPVKTLPRDRAGDRAAVRRRRHHRAVLAPLRSPRPPGRRPGVVRRCSLLIIILAFIGNWDIFTDYITLVLLAVFLQHAMALALGYGDRPGGPGCRAGAARR